MSWEDTRHSTMPDWMRNQQPGWTGLVHADCVQHNACSSAMRELHEVWSSAMRRAAQSLELYMAFRQYSRHFHKYPTGLSLAYISCTL